jgi:hypothetical protein
MEAFGGVHMAQKRVQTVVVKALLKEVRIMNRDAQRAAAMGSYLMMTTTTTTK